MATPRRFYPVWITCVALLSACSGDITNSDDDPNRCQGLIIDGACVVPTGQGGNTDWHPDPDGDGVVSGSDVCPYVYDVEQGDADSDGIGDYCDPDFVNVVEDGPVVDLRAGHVTPYGAWIHFTSPETTLYGRDYVVAWSTERADVESGSAVQALASDSKFVFRVFAYAGQPVERPQIITAMDPDTTYYIGVRPLNDSDQPSNKDGNLIEIHTASAPALSAAGSHPRAWASTEQLQALRDRQQAGDSAFSTWAAEIGPRALAAKNATEIWDFEYCISAALLFHATGEDGYRDSALTLIDTMKAYWENNTLEHNALRWADSNLAICADLMWDELSAGEREAIVAAYLQDNEAADNSRMVDTDEFASITRTWVIDGLVGCNAPGLSSELSKRSCDLLDQGLRAFYGVQLVKARRDRGFFAQSGGGLPDGIGYALGTSKYWMQTFHALANVGGQVDAYAPWVWHNLLSMEIHALTPQRRGFSTFGDLDAYDNFSVEPNSLPLYVGNHALVSMQMGFLERAGLVEQAEHAKWHVQNVFPIEEFGTSWAMLFYDHDGLASRSNEELSTSFLDSGLGMFYDRTGWAEEDSYFVFRAGWSGVDHGHEDAGSFQLYRKGVWLTHEALGYDGPSASARGHNVPALAIDFEGSGERVGQFAIDPAAPGRLQRSTSQEGYAFVAADLTGNYSSGKYHSFNYDAVQRHILWLKPSAEDADDRVIVYDLIDNAAGATPGERSWQLHIDSQPSLDGASARFTEGSNVAVSVAVPAGLTMSYVAPEGQHSEFPGEVYTGRLRADAQSAEASLRYVSVLRASDEESSATVEGVDSADVVGVVTGSELVLFPRAAAGAGTEDLVAEVSTAGLRTVFWTGLIPGESYSLSSEASSLRLSLGGSLEADEAGVLVGSL